MEENSIPPIADTLLSSNNEELIRRRQDVATYLYSGKPTDELADRYGVSISAIKNDVRIVRDWWRKFASQGISEMTEAEYAFALAQRADVLAQWQATHKGNLQSIILQWTAHIASLFGLYAPSKNINVNVGFDEYAKSQGVNLGEVSKGLCRELTAMIKNGTANLTQEEIEPLLEALGEIKDVTTTDNLL